MASAKAWAREAELLIRALGISSEHAREVRRSLLRAGGLAALFRDRRAALPEAIANEGDRIDAVLDLALRLITPDRLPPRIESADDVAAYFGPRLVVSATEEFFILMLDARNRPIGSERVAQGTLTACLVHPREVFGPAIRCRAAQIVIVHNHPSGDPTPSDEDRALTRRLAEAGELLGIPVLDHVVVARSGHRSIGRGEV
jgi:DNA repair protein RadC